MDNIDFWHYQIINTGTREEPIFGVHEVYFNGITKKIKGWTESPVVIESYLSGRELINDLEKILSDIKRHPILLESELEKDLL